MFTKKGFPFFELSRAHLHSKFRKDANKSKKNFLPKFNMGIKNAEFHADFKSVENVFKNCTKKLFSKNMTEICTFSTFTHVRQTSSFFIEPPATGHHQWSGAKKKLVLLITFFGAFLKNFFDGFEISIKFCFF
jgi:hypothetical protein